MKTHGSSTWRILK